MTEAPWQTLGIRDNIRSVIIQDGVTEICNNAFERCVNLQSVVMADTVEVVGSGAFNYSYPLYDLTLSQNLTQIGRFAFEGCQSLTAVSIPGSVSTISANAFSGCTSLSSLEIRAGVECIEDGAFSHCTSLRRVDIPASVVKIASGAFFGCSRVYSVYINGDSYKRYGFGTDEFNSCNNTVLYLPFYVHKEYLTAANDGAIYFWYKQNPGSIICDLTPDGYYESMVEGTCGETAQWRIEGRQLTISGSGVDTIPNSAFYSCEALQTVDFPDSLQKVEAMAFSGCGNLTTLTFPEGLAEISDSAFRECYGITDVYFKGSDYAGYAFTKDDFNTPGGTILHVPFFIDLSELAPEKDGGRLCMV